MTQQTMVEPLSLSQPDEVLLEQTVATGGTANGTAILSRGNQVTHVPAGAGSAYWGPGNQTMFLITGKETGGAFFLAEISVPPGGGPPPHINQQEEESFHLLEGTLTIQGGRGYTNCIVWGILFTVPVESFILSRTPAM